MDTTVSFGKRRVHSAPASARKPEPQPEIAPDADAELKTEETTVVDSPAQIPVSTSVPYLTLGLVVTLALIFNYLIDFTEAGALNGPAVLMRGQWWRLFTAPVLDNDIFNLTGNIVALLYAGYIFERLIGRRWFAALFVISAFGGSLGSLAVSDPGNLVSGAAGAVMGLLAAAFVCSFLFESEQLRKRMQRVSLRLLVPSLLPALLPLAAAGFDIADYSIQLGGAAAGAAMGFVLHEIWPEDALRPRGEMIALAIAVAGALLSAGGLIFIATR